MEQRFPRIGMAALAVSATQFLAVLFNGLLGWIPGPLFGWGATGMKFHIYPHLRQKLGLPYKDGSFWSDAGSLTGQEYAMILVMLVTLGVGLYGIQQRRSIDGPSTLSAEQQRARLDEQSVGVARPGGLSVINPTTASIVESVLGADETPTGKVISDALGEMTAVAMEMGVDEELVKGTIIEITDEDDLVPDSRYTVSIREDKMDVVDLTDSVPADSEDGADGWLDDSGWLDDVSATSESKSDSKPEIWMEEANIIDGRLNGMAIEHPKLGTTKVSTSTIINQEQRGEIHRIETRNTIYLIRDGDWNQEMEKEHDEAVAEPESEPMTVIAIPVPSSSTTSEVESEFLRPTAPREAASGTMPVRPSDLPSAAEYDIQQGCWTLFGRPVQFNQAPPPSPASSAPRPVPVAVPKTSSASDTGELPQLPAVPLPSNKSGKKLPALPSLPHR